MSFSVMIIYKAYETEKEEREEDGEGEVYGYTEVNLNPGRPGTNFSVRASTIITLII